MFMITTIMVYSTVRGFMIGTIDNTQEIMSINVKWNKLK